MDRPSRNPYKVIKADRQPHIQWQDQWLSLCNRYLWNIYFSYVKSHDDLFGKMEFSTESDNIEAI